MRLTHPAVGVARMTCTACPTQIEGRLKNGKFFYFRYRSGNATLDLADKLDPEDGACNGNGKVEPYGDLLQGAFDTEDELNKVFSKLIDRWGDAAS